MIDLHNHLIPGVDDGAVDLAESVQMVRQYLESGYRGAVCTSHYYPGGYETTRQLIDEGIGRLSQALLRQGLEFDLYPGNELFLDMNTLEKLNAEEVYSLNNSRFVLLELPFQTEPNYGMNMVYQLQLKGYVPILAHCERYTYVQKNTDWLLEYIRKGCLIQGNLSSLRSPEDSSTRKTLLELMDRHMIHFLCTDAHGTQLRSPAVADLFPQLKERLGEGRFQRILVDNPRKVVQNQFLSSSYDDIPVVENQEKPKKRTLFERFFRK